MNPSSSPSLPSSASPDGGTTAGSTSSRFLDARRTTRFFWKCMYSMPGIDTVYGPHHVESTELVLRPFTRFRRPGRYRNRHLRQSTVLRRTLMSFLFSLTISLNNAPCNQGSPVRLWVKLMVSATVFLIQIQKNDGTLMFSALISLFTLSTMSSMYAWKSGRASGSSMTTWWWCD